MTKDTLFFSGFPHTAKTDTRLSQKDGTLIASSAKGTLALDIDVGMTQGVVPEFDLDASDLADGATMTSVTIGTVARNTQETGRLTFEKRGQTMLLTPDFSAVGADTYEMILFREGDIVWRQSGVSGTAGGFGNFQARRRRACCRVVVYSLGNTSVAPFSINDGAQIDADNVFFIPENPTDRATEISRIELTATGARQLILTEVTVVVEDPFVMYRGLGDTRITAKPGEVTASVPAKAKGGVAVACGDVDLCELNLQVQSCPARAKARLLADTGDTRMWADLPLSETADHELTLEQIERPDASLTLDLPAGSEVRLSEIRIAADAGSDGTMRSVQAALRKTS